MWVKVTGLIAKPSDKQFHADQGAILSVRTFVLVIIKGVRKIFTIFDAPLVVVISDTVFFATVIVIFAIIFMTIFLLSITTSSPIFNVGIGNACE
jgi:hypothetical protein